MAVKVDGRAWGVTYTQHDADELDDLLLDVRRQRGDGGTSISELQALDEALEMALRMLQFAWPEQPEGGDEE